MMAKNPSAVAPRQDSDSGASLALAPLQAQTALAFHTSTLSLAQRTTAPIRAVAPPRTG